MGLNAPGILKGKALPAGRIGVHPHAVAFFISAARFAASCAIASIDRLSRNVCR
jgi:hypothetical protein